MAHKMSLCMHRDDTKLSPLALIDLFHPLTGTCHVTALWCGLFLVVCFWFCVFVFFLCLVFFVWFLFPCFLVFRFFPG